MRMLLLRGWVLLATLVAQGGAGAFLVLSRYSLSAELLHAALTGVVFTAAAYLCLRVTVGGPRSATAPSLRRPRGLRTQGAP